MHEIPAGTVSVDVCKPGFDGVWITDASSVEIREDDTSEVVLKQRPTTFFMFGNGGRNRQFASAQLIGETTLELPVVDESTLNISDELPTIGLIRNVGFVRGFPAGRWRLEVVFDSGEKLQVPVELTMGKMTQIQIEPN